MILRQVKAYIRERHQVSASDIENHFDLSADALEAIMDRLILQGSIIKLDGASCTSKCSTDCAQHQSHYLWLDHKIKPVDITVQSK